MVISKIILTFVMLKCDIMIPFIVFTIIFILAMTYVEYSGDDNDDHIF